jgi:hypothetical protein
MFEDLVQFEPDITKSGFTELDDASAQQVLDAQLKTVDWLAELGATLDDDIDEAQETSSARKAFQKLITTNNEEESKEALVSIKTPAAVRHLTGMLTAYDWEFIEQAKQLRGYTVAKIVEETKNPNANIRLKALTLLGKVTEVGLFTEKIEIKKDELSDAELELRIKEKLNRFMGVVDVVDIEQQPDTLTVEMTSAKYELTESNDAEQN